MSTTAAILLTLACFLVFLVVVKRDTRRRQRMTQHERDKEDNAMQGW